MVTVLSSMILIKPITNAPITHCIAYTFFIEASFVEDSPTESSNAPSINVLY